MKVNTTFFSVQRHDYDAPETIIVDMTAEGILCFSTVGTETLEEDDYNPWGTATN